MGGAFSLQFTAGTVWSRPMALGEVTGLACSPGCPGSSPDGYLEETRIASNNTKHPIWSYSALNLGDCAPTALATANSAALVTPHFLLILTIKIISTLT